MQSGEPISKMGVEEKLPGKPVSRDLLPSTRKRMVFGFSTVSLFLVIAVATTLYNVSSVAKQTDTIVNLRLPTAGGQTLQHRR